ncbi:MAG: Ig-like domain repeat protein [Coriobacteriia bacterium]|nr:Ig-like domain repeat protein [Coriobacteriia bacterium]
MSAECNSIVQKKDKWFVAVVFSLFLASAMILTSSISSTFALTQSTFTVAVDSSIDGDIVITLTDSMDPATTQTVALKKEPSEVASEAPHVATLSDFIDLDKTYDIKLVGMIGYEDYQITEQTFNDASITYAATDFDPLPTIMASGQVLDDNGNPYTGGGTVSFTGYDDGSVALADNGSFSVAVYKDKPYNFTVVPTDTAYCPISLGSINSSSDVAIEPTLLPLNVVYEIVYEISSGGTVEGSSDPSPISDGSVAYVNGGDDYTFTAYADIGYHVSSVSISIDGVPLAGGTFGNTQTEYFYQFADVSNNYLVEIVFSINTYSISFEPFDNGSVFFNGSPASPPLNVEHGELLSLVITPDEGYDLTQISLGGSDVAFSPQEGGSSYSCELSVEHDHLIRFIFSQVEPETSGGIMDYVNISRDNFIGDYPDQSGVYIYSYTNNNTTVQLHPAESYTRISLRSKGSTQASIPIYETTLIETIRVLAPGGPGVPTTIETVNLNPKILILIDTVPPVLTINTPQPAGWTNQDCIIEGRVMDPSSTDNPSSGLSKVVWSNAPLSDDQVIAESTEGTNFTHINADGTYSITIDTEQDEETFYLYALDRAQNVSEAETIVLRIDKTAPEIAGLYITKENGDSFDLALSHRDFGNFFNEKVRVTVIADDSLGVAQSGVGSIGLSADGLPINPVPDSFILLDDGTYKAEFILPESFGLNDCFTIDTLEAIATDNAGNVSVSKTLGDAYGSGHLMIESIDPLINVSLSEPVYRESATKHWYSEDVLFAIDAEDLDSGIRSVQITINGASILVDIGGNPVDADFFTAQTHKEAFLICTSQAIAAADGSYLLEVTVTDNAGNQSSENATVFVDKEAPSIIGYQFTAADSNSATETLGFVNSLVYGYFAQTGFTAVFQVEDEEPSSGLDKLKYQFVSYQDGENATVITGEQDIVNGVAEVAVPDGFKGNLVVEALDNVGNISGRKITMAFVVDSTNPEIHITNNSATEHRDADGNRLYITDVSFTATVSDYDSGIREIGYLQSSDSENGGLGRQTVLISNSNVNVGDILEGGWVVLEMDANLVVKVERTFVLADDGNEIVLVFDATDCSGNNKSAESEQVTIDKTAPIINVVFSNDAAINEFYYSNNRFATITVIERNFDPELIELTIENRFGNAPAYSFVKVSNTEHVAVIDFDEGEFTFSVDGTDLGNHPALVSYSGNNYGHFCVDKTAPVIEDNFDTFSKVETEDSFNQEKTASIRVIERNFDPELMHLTVHTKEAGEAHTSDGFIDGTSGVLSIGEWESSEDVHTLSFTFSRDGVYQIEMTPSDLAGNSSDMRSTVIFEIDTTPPIIQRRNDNYVSDDDTEFLDIYPFSRKDDPKPTIEFYDVNIDHLKYTLTAYTPYYTSSTTAVIIEPTHVFHDADRDNNGQINGGFFGLPTFDEDGIYTLELVAVDRAGNESLLNTNTFVKMAEHDVLAYILDSNLALGTGLYSFQYENGEAISKKPDDFNDIKILVFAKKDSGIDIVLRDNNAEEINTNLQAEIDGSIYGVGVHNYVLEGSYFQDNFQNDIDVELLLTVKNAGGRIDLGRLHIDNIAPTCELPKEFVSWHWYFGNTEREIVISDISERLNEQECRVFNNGEKIQFQYSNEDNTLTFVLSEGWHNVGLELTDMAGNTYIVQERANIHIGYFWLWVILLSSFLLVSAAAIVVVRGVRKRRRPENES